MTPAPKAVPISVVMPVHNALPFLDEAVISILAQTRSDFEFVIYDDHSTDGSYERLREWARQDKRIRLSRGERNLGPAASSSHVVSLASAPLVARMDADDVSLPERLEREAEVLDGNADVGIVACLCDFIDSAGAVVRGPELWRLARKSWFPPFAHGSMMFRRELYESIGGYRDQCEYWEDLDLVLRASERTRILVLPQVLYRYRHSAAGTRLASSQERVERAIDLRYRAVDRVREGRAYDDLLSGEGKGRGVDPRVFVSLGLLALWSKRRPDVAGFVRRARLRTDRRTAVSAAWLLGAWTAPGLVRRWMNLLSRLRNSAARREIAADEPFEWTPLR